MSIAGRPSLIEALDGPFAPWLGDPEPWAAWRTFIKVMTCEELEPAEVELFRACTGRTEPPLQPVTEAWCVVGRRGRKSSMAALLAVFWSVHKEWPRAPGETLRTLVIATSKDQASLIKSYAEAILRSRPGLERLIVSVDVETISLRNGVEIKCVANSFRSIRGPTVICAVFEEVAFWRDDNSANPDKEIFRAVRPSMLTAKGSVLIGISSPYAKKGLLYEKHRDHFGRDGSRVLVWQADTATMNRAADREEIEQAYEEDPQAATAEFGAQFRDDLSAFLDADLLAPLVRRWPLELPPRGGTRYFGFTDPSGGRGDAFALAIGHKRADDGVCVVDVVRAVPAPFDPGAVVRQYSGLLRDYRVSEVMGDNYSAAWAQEDFRKAGIRYRVSPRAKSEIYLESLPLFTRGEVELPDDRRLLVELAGLERRTARGGRDSVDHARNGHDDRSNVVCGVLLEAKGSTRSVLVQQRLLGV